MTTEQRSCTFYLTWFFQLYRLGEGGWQCVQTPDGGPIISQDSFFWMALCVIARKFNADIAHEQWKAAHST